MYKSIIAVAAIALVACGGSESKSETKVFYGESFDTTTTLSFTEARDSFLSNGTADALISGSVGAVCQTEGCWYRFAEDDKVMVDFDHAFKIPMDCKSKEIQAKGNFYYDTTSVEMLQEYAKDDEKTQEEIEAITESEIRLSFRALGVHIK